MPLRVNGFKPAIDMVYNMMRKDVFPRFINYDDTKAFLRDYQARKLPSTTPAKHSVNAQQQQLIQGTIGQEEERERG